MRIHSKFRWSAELKDATMNMMGCMDMPERLAGFIHNEYVDKPTELPNSKLLKEIIRLMKYCEREWGYPFTTKFLDELNKQMEWSGVEVTA